MADEGTKSQRLALILFDILAFFLAFIAAVHLRFTAKLAIFDYGVPPWNRMLNALPVAVLIWLVTLWACDAYEVERRRVFRELANVLKALFVMAGIVFSAIFFYRGFSYSRGFFAIFLPLLLALTGLLRLALRAARARIDGYDSARSRVLLVGATPVARMLAELSGTDAAQLNVVGVLDDGQPAGTELAPGVKILGGTRELETLANEHRIRGAIITDSKLEEGLQMELLERCLAANLEWRLVPSAYELMLDRMEIDVVAGVPLLGMRRSNIRGANRLLKRAFDIACAAFLLLVLSPLMLLVAALIKLSSKGPVLFKQVRVGEHGQPFDFLKFRSMHVNNDDKIHREYVQKYITEGADAVAAAEEKDGPVYKIKNDPRLIPIGAFIRKYSIDELPQLFNVLRGDMSLIGPRPPIPYEVEVYRTWHKRRFEGPPGITGLWQVSGRNRLSFDEMVKLDIEYLENWSFKRDLKILWRTMGVVLFDKAY